MHTPFDFINSINEKKSYLIESSADEKDYSPWIVNKGLSFHQQTVHFANMVNEHWGLDKKLQYDFLYHGVNKGKRWGKWLKKDIAEDDLKSVSTFYDVSLCKAEQIIKILTKEQLADIKLKLNPGGSGRKSPKKADI